ncbi:MAG TPA: precorrin-4 C(11)-methyltransferase [Firmicutes bacterium]|nr:precorrin-4 C(11)-methyltransferase [Bacillota bacterium]
MIYFIGAGPGDPELISVKGARLIGEADVVIYAGSLVNPAILRYAGAGAQIYDSAGLTRGEILAIMQAAVREGKTVARVHTGDPALFGAIQEQMDALAHAGIAYEVIPGISSFLAAAAALKREYTLPDVTQTVIITRMEGRTSVPEKEKLAALAVHRATMCIFLSVHMLDAVVRELQAGGYTGDTPAAVIQKASWPEEKIIAGTLETIGSMMQGAGIDRTALIIVGDFLRGTYSLSKLYDPSFAHGYREAEK